MSNPGASVRPATLVGRRTFRADLLEELSEQIPIRENGRERPISKQRAFIKALVAAAIKGDMRATSALVSFCTRLLGEQTDEDVDAAPVAEDIDIIEAFVDRQRKQRRSQKTETKPPEAKQKES